MRECEHKIEVAQAHGQVVAVQSDDDGSHLRDEAFAQGIADFENERTQPPPEFSHGDMLRWWNEGYDFAAELDEMSCCSGCNDSTGNPCITHS